jgi:hypothetical protein
MAPPGFRVVRWTLLHAATLLAASLAAFPGAASPGPLPQCADGVNNDLGDDGYEDGVDILDPDCESPMDDRERGPSCNDHIDNDGDRTTDYVDDPTDTRYASRDLDCLALDQDSEDGTSPCEPPEPSGCGGPSPCRDLTPPTNLRASWTPDGVLLDWDPPASSPAGGGSPDAYLVYRAEPGVGFLPAAGLRSLDHAFQATDPFVGTGPTPNAPVEPRPLAPPDKVLAGVVDLDGLAGRAVPLAVTGGPDPLDGATQPMAATPGDETSHLDGSAQPGATYAYWVTAAGSGCQGLPSAPIVLEPHIPDLSDCLYVQSFLPPETTKPSLNCLQGVP